MSWVTVNMQWRITRSDEGSKLGQEFIAAVDAAKARWKAENPDHINLDTVNHEFNEVFEVQDQYPWLREHLVAPDLEQWRVDSLLKCDDVPPGLRVKMRALVVHRFWYRLESDYINEDPEVVRTQKACEARRKLEQTMDFVHHPDCQVGVQIEILSEGKTRRLLIGDIVPSGTDSGCCQDGIKDEDIVVRYRDFRHLLKEQDV